MQESIINPRLWGMFLLERKQQMLIFFWSSSSELWATRERFLLASAKKTLALNHSRELVVRRRLLVSRALAAARPRTCWMSKVKAAVPPAPPAQTPFPSLPSRTGTWAAFPSLMENHCFASFRSFFSNWLSVVPWEEIFKKFAASGADFHYGRLVWGEAHSSRKPRVSILKQNAIIRSVGRLSWFPYKCR